MIILGCLGGTTIWGNIHIWKTLCCIYFTAMLFRFFTLYIYPTKKTKSQDKYLFEWNYFSCDVCQHLWHLVVPMVFIPWLQIFHGKQKKYATNLRIIHSRSYSNYQLPIIHDFIPFETQKQKTIQSAEPPTPTNGFALSASAKRVDRSSQWWHVHSSHL